MRSLLPLAALAATLASPVAAGGKLDARAMLVASTPARNAVLDAAPEAIELTFAEPARVISVTLRLPDDSEVSAEPEQPTKRGRAKQLRYRLPALASQPGEYTISYLLVSKSFKSLNGFVHFRIPGAVAAPPADAAEDTAVPVEEPRT